MSDEPRNGGWRHSAGLLLAVLLAAYILAFADRQIINLFVQPIKADLGLSDIDISFLQGLSFATFMCLGGIPIGRLVDTQSRTRLLAIGIALWSLATAGSGFSNSFVSLLLARTCVGIGEAVMTPTAYSLLGDSFPPGRQGLAMGTYNLGIYFGAGGAMLLGGALIQHLPAMGSLFGLEQFHGWQFVFLLMLIPGAIITLFIAVLPEPQRGRGVEPRAEPVPSWREVLAWYRTRWSGLVAFVLTISFAAMAQYALLSWMPAFYQRSFGLGMHEIGQRLGWIIMIAGASGALVAGLAGDRLIKKQVHGRTTVQLVGALGAIPLLAAATMVSDARTSMACLAAGIFFLAGTVISGPAILQQITPPRMRGLNTAFVALITNLLGLGLAPTIVAFITERVLHSDAKLGEALSIVLPATLVVVACSSLFLRWKLRIFGDGLT
jgi:MFS family permease